MKTFGSLFSGIGGFDLGLERAGFDVRWQIENDKFCNRILERHWSEVTRYGDITAVDPHGLDRVELIAFGFPCQDLSVAGKREGLASERSQLFWEAIRLIAVLEPRWLLIENVPGLFNSNASRDFLEVINALDELRYGVAWRVLDSQYFGVPQRRRRVYIVGHLGKPCPPEILFDSLVAVDATSAKTGLDVGCPEKADINDENNRTGPVPICPERDNRNGGTILHPNGGGKITRLSGRVDRLDRPRYRTLGNAVTVNVAEWIGRRIMKAIDSL